MKPIFALVLVLLSSSAIQAQRSPVSGVNISLRQVEIPPKHLKILARYLDNWIAKNNRQARGVVIYKFEGFLDLPVDLQKNANQAFPRYLFTVAAFSIYHKAWVKENFYFLTKRKTGKILAFSSNPLGRQQNVFETFGDPIVSRRPNDESEALFIAKTFAEIFLFDIQGRIGEIKRSATDISILMCHGTFGIRDYGRTLSIKFKPGFRFERPTLNSELWLSKQCAP